jgi:hypothetical protein
MTLSTDTSATTAIGTGTLTTSFSGAHSAKGVLVMIAQDASASDQVSGVTFDGVAMSRVAMTADAAGETGAVYAYFLGVSVPAGTDQVISASVSGAADKVMHVRSINAATDTALAGTTGFATANGDQANPSVTVTGIGGATPTLAYGVLFSGQNAPGSITPGSGSHITSDFGNQTASFEIYSTPSSGGDRTISWTVTSDDVAAIGIAIQEVASTFGPPFRSKSIHNALVR